MSRVKVVARIYGPRLMRRARKLPVDAQLLLDRALVDVADQAETFFKDHAPEDKGRLKRGITATPTATGVSIRVAAKDPETGYDYVGVTRFGHKVRRIRPIAGRTKSGRRIFRPGFLRLEIGGRVLYRTSVRGVVKKVDWVVPARAESRVYAREQMKQVGAEIARRWGD